MADNDKDVRIKIGTEADTSGAESAEEAIKRVTQAANVNPMTDGSQLRATKQTTEATKEQAEAVEDLTAAVHELSQEEEAALKKQRDNDLERAEAMKRGREEAEQAKKNLDDLYNQQRLQGIGRMLRDMATEASRFAQEFSKTERGKEILSGLSEEMTVFGATAASVTSGVATGFATGGPVGAAIGGITGLIKTLGDEWINTNKRIEDSNRDLDRAIDESRARIEARKKAAIDRAVEERFAAERAELQKQREELEHIRALRDSQRGLDDAKDKLNDQRAAQAGAPQSSIDLGNIAREFAGDVQGLEDQIAESRSRINILSKEVGITTEEYQRTAKEFGTEGKETVAAFKNLQQALAEVASAQGYLEALEERLPIEQEKFRVAATTAIERKFADSKEEIGKTVTASAKDAIEEIEEIRKDQGGEITRRARDILEEVKKIVADGIPDADQAEALKLLMSQFRSTVEGQQKEQSETFAALMDGFRESTAQLQQAKAEIQQIKSWMKTQPPR